MVYNQVFLKKDYDIDFGDPIFIVDAGAHIGLSSVYFASKYPNASVVAIEPEQGNFDILLKNTKGFSNIRVIQAALWSRKTYLRIEDPDAATWSFRLSEGHSEQKIPAMSLEDVMSDYSIPKIDLLKMDIEGSEQEVLKHYHSWIDRVNAVVIELHDNIRPGCSEALDKAISGLSYDKYRSGENVVIVNLRAIDA